MKTVLVTPDDISKLERLLETHNLEYDKIEGSYASALKLLVSTDMEVAGFRMRHNGIKKYMPKEMRERYESIVPSLFKTQPSNNLLSGLLPGLVTLSLAGHGDTSFYIIKGVTNETDTNIMRVAGYYQIMEPGDLEIWKKFVDMSDDEKSKLGEEISNFLLNFQKLESEISSWWEEKESKRLSEN